MELVLRNAKRDKRTYVEETFHGKSESISSTSLLVSTGAPGPKSHCRKTGNRVNHNFCFPGPFLSRTQNDTFALDLGIERIARLQPQPPTNRAGQNDLAFGGNFGLHGKTILPLAEAELAERPGSFRPMVLTYSSVITSPGLSEKRTVSSQTLVKAQS